jgi:hypothetical protein
MLGRRDLTHQGGAEIHGLPQLLVNANAQQSGSAASSQRHRCIAPAERAAVTKARVSDFFGADVDCE